MKKIDLKIKFVIAVSVLIFTLGAVTNLLFMPVALGYMASVILAYYFGSKIKDIAMNVGYIWFSKWVLFTVFLIFTGIYTPDIFLYALALFVLFNISVNPKSFMLNNKGV